MTRYFVLVDPNRAGAPWQQSPPVLIAGEDDGDVRQRAYMWAANEMVQQDPTAEQIVLAVGELYQEYACGHAAGIQYTLLVPTAVEPPPGGTDAPLSGAVGAWLALAGGPSPEPGTRLAITLCGWCAAQAEGMTPGPDEFPGGGYL